MTIELSDATDPNLHEPKGASSASNLTVYTSNGLGSGSWSPQLSLSNALMTMRNNSTVTTITAADTPVLITGAWTEESAGLYDTTVSGRATHLDSRTKVVNIDTSLTLDVSAGTVDVTAYVYKNGSQIPESERTVSVTSGSTENLILMWQSSMDQTDYIEVYVENNTDDADITVTDAILRIKA